VQKVVHVDKDMLNHNVCHNGLVKLQCKPASSLESVYFFCRGRPKNDFFESEKSDDRYVRRKKNSNHSLNLHILVLLCFKPLDKKFGPLRCKTGRNSAC
jgi:hypothetical protein